MLKRKLIKPFTEFYAMIFLIATTLIAAGQQPSADTTGKKAIEDSIIAQQVVVPVELNAEAKKFTSAYIKQNSASFYKIKERSDHFFPIIDSLFSKAGIPLELKYLAVIESNLKPSVTSKAGAAGLWQLMPVAGRSLGLKMSKGNDERRHTYKSTLAAAKLLKQLYEQFDNWLLALAAYNSGPGNLRKAIRKAGTDDFWKLQSYLPLETRRHVKKFISMQYYFDGDFSKICLTKKELTLHNEKVEKMIAINNKTTDPITSAIISPVQSSVLDESAKSGENITDVKKVVKQD